MTQTVYVIIRESQGAYTIVIVYADICGYIWSCSIQKNYDINIPYFIIQIW